MTEAGRPSARAERAPAAALTVAVLVDVQLAVIVAATLMQVVQERRASALVTLMVAMTPSVVRLVRRGRSSQRWSAWGLIGLDVVAALGILTVMTTDSFALVFIATTIAITALEGGAVPVAVVTSVVAFVHLAAGLPLLGERPATALLVVPVRVAIFVLVAVGALRLRELVRHWEALREESEQRAHHRAREEERARLAREMHDSLSKTLHGVALLARHGRGRLAAEGHPLAAQLAVLGDGVDRAQAEARQLIADLRTQTPASLVEQLPATAGEWSRHHGIPVHVHLPDQEPAAPPEAREGVIKAVEELLENVARHAQASRVDLRMTVQDGWLLVDVSDDGRGMAAPDLAGLLRTGHFGLVGAGERLSQVGGRLEVGPGRGGGTHAGLRVPLATADTPVASRAGGLRAVPTRDACPVVIKFRPSEVGR